MTEKYHIDVIILNYDMCNMKQEQWDEIDQLLTEKNVTALFNNVGTSTKGYFHEIPTRRISNVITLNIEIMLKITHMFINHTKTNQKNLIIFISSMTASHNSPLLSMYSSSKAFIKQFGRSVSYEYQHIDCTVFDP